MELDVSKKDIIKEEKQKNKEEKVEEEKETVKKDEGVENEDNKEVNKENVQKELKDENEDKEKDDLFIENAVPRKEREPVKRTVSAPGSVQEVTACCTVFINKLHVILMIIYIITNITISGKCSTPNFEECC